MRKTLFLLLALLLLPLYPHLTVEAAPTPFPIKVGYSPEKMFDVNVGLPVFVAGEAVWVYPGEPVIMSLTRPDGRPAAAIPIGGHPFQLYRFTSTDRLGTWLLRIESRRGSFTFPIELSQQLITPNSNDVKFSLREGSLAIQGTIDIAPSEIPSSTDVILARKGKNDSIVDVATNVTIASSQLLVQVIKKEGNTSTIRVAPYTPSLFAEEGEGGVASSGPVVTTWAEITIEIPLTKRTGRSIIVTYVDEAIARTPKVATQLAAFPDPILALKISPRGIIEDTGTVPTKLGRATLNVFVQQASTINIAKIPIVILPGRIVIQPAAVSSAIPFAQPLSYEFLDSLENLSTYEIILATKINGLDNVWSTVVTPPVASVRVTNTIGGEAVSNYDVNFTSGVVQKSKVGERTFGLLQDRRITTAYTLAIDGIMQKEGEYQPATITMAPLTEGSIFASQGKVSFRVMGGIGIPAPEGNITIYRTTGDSLRVIKEYIWPGGGSVNTTLPQGTYRVVARVLGNEQSSDFEVKRPQTNIEIQMQNLFTRDDLYLVGGASVVITAELVFAILVWRRALRSK
ncbi:MAG: hypothetical protein HYU02_00535 [Thaumarchaeota archaeon]|nr:hypothetical protein [Nitrososphaerota archaeon]